MGRCGLQGGAGGKGTRVSMPPRAAAARTRALSVRSSAYRPKTDAKRTRRTGPARAAVPVTCVQVGWDGTAMGMEGVRAAEGTTHTDVQSCSRASGSGPGLIPASPLPLGGHTQDFVPGPPCSVRFSV